MAEGDGEVVIYRDPAAEHAAPRYPTAATPPPRRAPPTAPAPDRGARTSWLASFLGWAVATFFLAFFGRIYDVLMGTTLSRAIPFSLSLREVAIRDIAGFLLILAVSYMLGAYVARRLRPTATMRGAPLVAWTLAFIAASAFLTRFFPARAAMLPAYAPAFNAASTTPLGVGVALTTLLVLTAAAWAGSKWGAPRPTDEAWPGGVPNTRRGRPE